MERSGRLFHALLSLLLLGTSLTGLAQGDCLNVDQYPAGSITPDNTGALTTISTCSFEQEYSVITGIISGAPYQFALSSGGYITVRQGTFDGPVIGQGLGTVDVVAVDGSDLFPHWNTDDLCGTAATCQITTVQLVLDCTPATATATIVEDCDQQLFTILVDVTSIGDGASANIVYDVFGFIQTLNVTAAGQYELGPFFFGEEVVLSVEHESDPLCNLNLGLFAETGLCPTIINCGVGPVNQAYCYGNTLTKVWNYVSDGSGGSLVLTFLDGTIQASVSDQFVIYDGTDATGPILFQHTANATVNLGGLFVASTTGAFHLVLTTNGAVSCVDGDLTSWLWQVECLNCVLPQGTATSVDDCPNNQFSIPVDITNLGDGSAVNIIYIVNNGTPQVVSGAGLGQTIVGPFTVNDQVTILLENDLDPACTISLGNFTDEGNCPNLIVCGSPAIEETYCYTANDSHSWSYSSLGVGTLRLTFERGTIESNTFDDLRIYDGVDATGTLVFEHTNATAYNLGPVGSAVNNALTTYYGIQIYSVTGSLYMEMTSDGSVQCGTSTTYDPWEWNVVCLDCTIPQGTVTVVDDCANSTFTLEVDVTSTGNASTVNIEYTVDGGALQEITGVGLGITSVGPFLFGETVAMTLAHESNDLCDISFGVFSDTGTCPDLIDCGTPQNDILCFGNNADARYYYQGTGTDPLAIYFNSGVINGADLVSIYDGGDITAPLLYQGINGGDMTGVLAVSTNPAHRLTLRITSDGFTSCATNTVQVPLDWTVDCLDCVAPTATFSVVQDCDNFQYFIDVIVTDLGSDNEMEITNTGGAATVSVTGPGTYQIGPFVSGTPTQVTLVNDANSLCNLYSAVLVNPLCPELIVCGDPALVETYCYVASDSRAWAYAAVGSGTMRLTFVRGTIESNTFDHIRIYDGVDATGTLLFDHTNTTTYNLGPVGSAINNVLTTYYGVQVYSATGNFYMEMSSDGSIQCSGSTDYDAWEWNVVCLDCVVPQATAIAIDDCTNSTFTVEVDITDVGDGATAGLEYTVNAGSPQQVIGLGVGTTVLGPFNVGEVVVVTMLHESNAICNVPLGSFTDSGLCPTILCGSTPLVETYCYVANDDQTWWYAVPSGGTVRLLFNRGTIESNTWDHLTIYDGPNATSPVLFDHANGLTSNLGPVGSAVLSAVTTYYAVDVTSTSGNIYMTMSADGSVQCSTSTNFDPWEWAVQCLGCDAPGVAYDLTLDCIHREYSAEVSITEDPSASGLEIMNMGTGTSQVVNTTGVYVFGPYDIDLPTVFGVTDLATPNCTFTSDPLSVPSDTCVIRSCGYDTYSLCYGNNEDVWYTYQSIEPVPTSINFIQGTMLLGDAIEVYNGYDDTAGSLYQGINGGSLAGFAINSQNAEYVVTLHIRSDGSGSCADGTVGPSLEWFVGCGYVGIDEGSSNAFSLYPNPTDGMLYVNIGNAVRGSVRVRVTDMSGRTVIEQPMNIASGSVSSIDMNGLRNGQYAVQVTTDDWTRTERVQLTR